MVVGVRQALRVPQVENSTGESETVSGLGNRPSASRVGAD